MTHTLSVAGAIVLMLWMPVSAHHSRVAEFDLEKPVALKGVLSKMEWVNPHGWIYIDVKAADGSVATWAIETEAASALFRRGLRRTDFEVGLEIVVEGFLARARPLTASGTRVTFPDGRAFSAGAGGPGGAPAAAPNR